MSGQIPGKQGCRKCWQKRVGITQSGTPLLRWHDDWCPQATEYDMRRQLLTPAERERYYPEQIPGEQET
jgi:hypothetical protein